MTQAEVSALLDKARPLSDEFHALLRHFTDEQKSLAWCPEPPYESEGGSDCRMGGSCGLDLSGESRRSQWVRARFRFRREQEKALPKKPRSDWSQAWRLGGAA
jgi:hypothetical protein